ncbi:hypothetical protein L5515_007074 [Caenorhabditis briggsae]|uniref:Uncharacterized protein n=1 Tax=Caenorhabditis briggsae TaxID=6238 RepID=A0AAE9F3Q2_CAEBR|nr:hypothetical protein L5515_007074 [Caenorhabditis briggsae]
MLRIGGGRDRRRTRRLLLSLFLRGQRGNYDGHGFGEQEETRGDSARRRKNANEGRRDAPEKRRRHDGAHTTPTPSPQRENRCGEARRRGSRKEEVVDDVVVVEIL